MGLASCLAALPRYIECGRTWIRTMDLIVISDALIPTELCAPLPKIKLKNRALKAPIADFNITKEKIYCKTLIITDKYLLKIINLRLSNFSFHLLKGGKRKGNSI
jgi:hypothetical protein